MLAQPMSKTSIAALFSEGKTRTAVASSRVARPVWRRNSYQSRGSKPSWASRAAFRTVGSAFFVLMDLKVDLSSLIEARRARSRSNLDRLRRYWKIDLRIGSRRIRYPPLGRKDQNASAGRLGWFSRE